MLQSGEKVEKKYHSNPAKSVSWGKDSYMASSAPLPTLHMALIPSAKGQAVGTVTLFSMFPSQEIKS